MLAALIGLAVWLPHQAAASTIYADLDNDGIRDIVTVAAVPRSGLQVWLSKTGTSILLPTRRPILAVTASDLDGDGDIELVAADTSARVHVWHRNPHGKIRVSRPRPKAPPSTLSSTARQVSEPPDEHSTAVLTGGSTTPMVDSVHPARATSLTISLTPAAREGASTAGAERSPWTSRGPPLS